MNYFSFKSSAELYAKGRPGFHNTTIDHIRKFLQLKVKVGKALDIACGTGLSTKPLLTLAEEVYGTDASMEMLAYAPAKDQIKYKIAPAEAQPFEKEFFDLLTVCSAIHWFDIDKFLTEAHRILKPSGWLVLYDNFFLGEMEGFPEFTKWYQNAYLKKFPAPLRNENYNWSAKNSVLEKMSLLNEEKFRNKIEFTRKQLCLYFMTQSNVIRAVEDKIVTYKETELWLNDELSTFFITDNEVKSVVYGNWIKYIQKQGDE